MKKFKYKYKIVTFRVDEDLEKMLVEIQEVTGENISDILRKALIIYNHIINVLQNPETFIKETV